MLSSKLWLGFTCLLTIAGSVMVFIIFTTAMREGKVSPIAALSAFLVLFSGPIFYYIRENPRPAKVDHPDVHINWFLTDVNMHFSCPCTPDQEHQLEGFRFGRFRCPSCAQMWEIPSNIKGIQLLETKVS